MGEREGDEAYEFIFGESDAITQQFYRNRARDHHISHDIIDMNNNYGSIPHPSRTNIYGHYHSSSSPHASSSSSSSPPSSFSPVRRSRISLWRDILSIIIIWIFSFISPSPSRSRPRPRPPPHFISDDVEYRSAQQRSFHDVGANRERRNTSGGLSESQINQLTTITFQPSMEDDKCMICQSEYEMGDELIVLPCTHKYHQHCIRPWLQNNKLCCVCKMEVNV